MRGVAIILLMGLTSPWAEAQWPAPLQAALERSNTGPNYAFDVTHVTTSIDEDGVREERAGYARVDLSRPPLKQITPAHILDDTLPGSAFDALADLERNLEDGIWCTRFVEDVPEDVELIAEDSETLTYEFTPNPAEDARGPEKKIARRTKATLIVSKNDPAVLSYTRQLTRTVSVFVVAKLRRIDTTITCARAPDGRTYVAHFETFFEGSGVGFSGTNESKTEITALYDPVSGAKLASLLD